MTNTSWTVVGGTARPALGRVDLHIVAGKVGSMLVDGVPYNPSNTNHKRAIDHLCMGLANVVTPSSKFSDATFTGVFTAVLLDDGLIYWDPATAIEGHSPTSAGESSVDLLLARIGLAEPIIAKWVRARL